MSEISESKKPRVTSGIKNMLDEVSKWYHNTTQWCYDSWDDGVSCHEQIEYEMEKVDKAYEQLQKQNQELIKALEFYADRNNYINDFVKIEAIVTWHMETNNIKEDDGEKAREVLAKYQKGDL